MRLKITIPLHCSSRAGASSSALRARGARPTKLSISWLSLALIAGAVPACGEAADAGQSLVQPPSTAAAPPATVGAPAPPGAGASVAPALPVMPVPVATQPMANMPLAPVPMPVPPPPMAAGPVASVPAAVVAPPLVPAVPPVEMPEQPVEMPEQPAEMPEQPVEMPEQPVEVPEQPVEMPEQPVEMPAQPVELPEQPAEMPEQPVELPEQPVELPEQPVEMPEQPVELPEQPAPTDDLWVSPDGDDGAEGSEAAPLRSIQTAALKAVPGSTIWVMAGTHSYDARIVIHSTAVPGVEVNTAYGNPASPGMVVDGTADQPIRIQGVAGARPVLDFKPQRDAAKGNGDRSKSGRGFIIWANYWELRNLEIKDAADNCILVAGSHNVFDNLDIHDCGDTGLQITVPKSIWSKGDGTGAHNRIVNCDSHDNFDEVTGGEDADGFAAKDRVGPGNEFHGCRAWGNTDDGWDFYSTNALVKLSHCWAFSMKHPRGTGDSDGNGFKLGGQRDGDPTNNVDHELTSCFAFDNPNSGFDRNNNQGNPTCTGCGAWNNGTDFEPGIRHTGDVSVNVSSEQARSAKRGEDGSLPDITSL